MSLVITTSPNISVFDYLVNIDLTTNKINLNDNSTYIGGGAALVKGIDFVITNQVGTLIWSNTNFTTPDINPAAPATFTKPLPTFNGMLEWGNYTVVGTIKDQDGTLYTLTKQLNICKPPQNDVTTGNYGIASIMYRIDCADAKIILGDYTTYVYNGVTGISTVAWTVYQPPTLNLAPISATAPYVNISPIYLGDYTVLFQSSATYNFGNGWTVIVGYTATAKFPVQCDVNLCDVYCELEKVVKQYETTANLSPSAAQDLKNIIDTATVEIELIQIGIACGKDVSSHKQVLKDILGVDCGCGCGLQVPVQPTSICCSKDINTVAGCGDVSVTKTTAGSLTTWTISDTTYVMAIDAGQTGLIVSATTNGCTKTYSLSICVDNTKICNNYTICSLNSSVVAPDRPTIQNISVASGSPLSTIISDINSAICQLNAYAQYFYDGINATPPDWNTLTLINGFSNVGAGYQTAQYRKWTSGVNIGKVEVRGFIKKSAFDGTRTTFANMPVGYAPSTEQVESTSMTSNGVAPSSELLYVSNASGFEAECTVDSPVNVTFPINFDYYTS